MATSSSNIAGYSLEADEQPANAFRPSKHAAGHVVIICSCRALTKSKQKVPKIRSALPLSFMNDAKFALHLCTPGETVVVCVVRDSCHEKVVTRILSVLYIV